MDAVRKWGSRGWMGGTVDEWMGEVGEVGGADEVGKVSINFNDWGFIAS